MADEQDARSAHEVTVLCACGSEVVQWAIEQSAKGRKLVALIAPTETHDGPRYAGYYCIDGPEPGIERG